MPYFLDIIIPEYNCKEEFLDRLFKSIIRQENINLKEIGIIVVNDCSSKVFKNGFFRKYPQLNICYLKKDVNEGVGMTRQYGLDKSTAKYVTFVDQDDELYGNDSLGKIVSYLKDNNPELLLTSYLEELKNTNDEISYHLYEPFDTKESVHGVFINRDSMIKNGIKFIPDIRYHDDFYIRRILTTVLVTNTLNVVSYVWKYNQESQVRIDRDSYQVKTFSDIFRAVEARIDFFDSKNIFVNELSVCSILMLFFILEYDDFKDVEAKDTYERELYRLVCKNSAKIESLKDQFNYYYDEQYDYYKRTRTNVAEKKDFFEFISKMSKKYPEYKYEIMDRIKFLNIFVFYNADDLLMKTLDSILCQRNIDRSLFKITIIGKKATVDLPEQYINGSYENFVRIQTEYQYSGKTLKDYKDFMDDDFKYITFLNNGNILYEYTTLYKLYDSLMHNGESKKYKLAKFEDSKIIETFDDSCLGYVYCLNDKKSINELNIVDDYFLVIEY